MELPPPPRQYIHFSGTIRESQPEHGRQPLADVMTRWGLCNHDLTSIAVADKPTLKQLQRARDGHHLPLHVISLVTKTFNETIYQRLACGQRQHFTPYDRHHLFNYIQGFQRGWNDPNQKLQIFHAPPDAN